MVAGDSRITHARTFVMKIRVSALFFSLQLAVSLSAADLSTAPLDELMYLYQQLRSLRGSDRGAVP
jgi:hypothetical protein